MLIGDFLTEPDRIATAVQAWPAAAAAATSLMVVDPIEETFPFSGQAVLHDLEGGLSLDIGDAGAWGDRYRARIAAHRAGLLGDRRAGRAGR